MSQNLDTDQLTTDVIQEVRAFVQKLRDLGVEQVFLRHGYSHTATVVKTKKFFSGRIVVARKERGMDLVFATFKETTGAPDEAETP